MLRFCPKCGELYADALLAFCLADGTPLGALAPDSDVWKEGRHEPIIDLDTFERCGAKLASRRGGKCAPRAAFLLSGLLRCGHCGRAMIGRTRRWRGGLRCRRPRCHGRAGCRIGITPRCRRCVQRFRSRAKRRRPKRIFRQPRRRCRRSPRRRASRPGRRCRSRPSRSPRWCSPIGRPPGQCIQSGGRCSCS